MRKAFLFLILILVMQLHGCFRDNCEESEAPLIEFGIDFGGRVIVTSSQTGLNLTSQYAGSELNIMMYKVYCSAKINGPFEEKFILFEDGTLSPQTLGFYSFKMNNLKDYIDLNFFFEGHEIFEIEVAYPTAEAYNGGKLTQNYLIEVFWDAITNSPDRTKTKVTLLK